MADSTLDPDLQTRPKPAKGEGTESLGPSSSSDSGSDLQGPGLKDIAGLGMDRGTTSDIVRRPGAGADVGDANLDSDSDATGTGETATAGRDTAYADAPDISPDRIMGGDMTMPADALDRISIDDQAAGSEEEDRRGRKSGDKR